jgi:hypothetical protein
MARCLLSVLLSLQFEGVLALTGGFSLKRIVIFILTAFSLNSFAQQSASMAIPIKTIGKPASDLIGPSGQVLEVGEAAQMSSQGIDLSNLNPKENKLWQNQKYPGVDTQANYYPQAEAGVQYLSASALVKEMYTLQARVSAKSNPNAYFRLTLSRMSHNALMRAVLLRKLGFFIYNPKYYSKLRVYFSSEDQKNMFIEDVQKESVIVDLVDRKWILDDDKKNHSLLLADVILEINNPDYLNIATGMVPNSSERATLELLAKYRAFRSLIIPFLLVDIPESINRYSPKFGSVLAGHVVLTYPYADSFTGTGWDDARWVLHKILQLNESDLREIVNAGAFPADYNELVYAKLVYRIRNAAELFDLNSEFRIKLPNLNISTPSGYVKDGKVMKEDYPGYPIRFAHGDRPSPFAEGDLGRYLGLRGKSAVIATAIGEFNKKLQVLKMETAASKHAQDIRQRIIDHIRANPREPLYQKVEAWGGPVGGFNISANRSISTGTYYDSSAPIQLVDNISVAGSLGYFMALDGVPKVMPMAGGNVSLMRDYTHVRPILSMTEAKEVEWNKLIIPAFMNRLANILKEEKTTEKDGDGAEVDRYAVDKLMAELKTGEVFTVTDSLVTTAYAQISSSLDVLMGIAPLNFMNTISAGADASRVTLRQTSIMKTDKGLQIYVRSQNSKIFGLTLDANYFINVMKIRAQTQAADIKTDAFIVNYSPALSDSVEGSKIGEDVDKTRESLRPALAALLKDNNAALFYKNFKYQQFHIDHELKTKELRAKFLLMRANSFTEDHWAKILYPRSEEAPELNPEDEKVVLFSHKKGQLVGRDLLGMGIDVLQNLLNRKSKVAVDLGASQDPNPANAPFGKAYWRTINTEADLSPNGDRYPTVAVLSHVWGGWKLKRDAFFKLMDDITGQFKDTPVGSYRIIEKEAFMNVKSIDFYRINAILSVLPGGVARVKDLITQPKSEAKQEKAKFLSRFFQKLSEKKNGARPQDKDMYKEIMKIIGNGDTNAGEASYLQTCQENYQKTHGSGEATATAPSFWKNGNNYKCLDTWMDKLMTLAATYPQKDEAEQVRWMTQVLYILDEYIPVAQILNYLGQENFIFTIRINGFRTGDEDADLEYFSNSVGEPKKNIDYANGLFQMFANKTGITPVEIDRSLGGFK